MLSDPVFWDVVQIVALIVSGALAVIGALCVWEWICWGCSRTLNNLKSWMIKHDI